MNEYTPITEIVVIWLNTNHSFLTSKSDFHKSLVAFHFTSIEFDYKSIKYQSMSQATSHKSEWVKSILFWKWLDTEIHNGLFFFVMILPFQHFFFILHKLNLKKRVQTKSFKRNKEDWKWYYYLKLHFTSNIQFITNNSSFRYI